MKPDEDHPQHQLRCDRSAGVQEDHLPEHHQGDEGDDHDVKNGDDGFSREQSAGGSVVMIILVTIEVTDRTSESKFKSL